MNLDANIPDELRSAFDDLRAAQVRIDADRDALRKRILDAEPSWGPCSRCGHTWRSKNLRSIRLGKPPRRCPKCHSTCWFDPVSVPRGPQEQAPPAHQAAEKDAGTATAQQEPKTPPAGEPAVPAPGGMAPPPRFEPPSGE